MATVLVVDDRIASREIARATLDHGGYRVIEATEGEQAFALAKNSHPDIVLTDVLMPGMDGYQLVRELRGDPGTAGIPVLFFTANYRQDEAQPLAAALGVSKILSKDALPQELLAAVAAALHDQPARVALAGTSFGVEHVGTVNAKLLEKVQALDQSEARFAAMAQASPVGIVITDPLGQASYVNPRLAEITQAPAAELLGQGWQRCLGHDQREALRASPGRPPPSPDGERRHEQLTLPGGGQRWLTILVRPVRDSEDAPAGFVAMIDDVTAVVEADERRRAEDRERESKARARVRARFDSLARLAGGVAHDFNNLLNIVMSYDQFVKEAVTDASGAVLTDAQAQAILGDVDQIYRAGQRAAHLSRQLLTFGGRQAVQPAVINVNVLIGEVRDMIAGTIGQHVTITTRPDPGLGHVRADASQLSQVLLNLAVNARDAMPDGGSLHFETGSTRNGASGQAPGLPAGEYVHVTVTDTGHGMSAATAAQAMEPFFTTKPPDQGTGLGLATAYGVIRQAGGELIIDSAPGRGTTIHLYLPATGQPADAAKQVTVVPPSAGQTILVADDEDGLRQAVTRILTGAGYHVLAAPNGQEALTIAEHHDGVIHALLTDVAMPVMNGRELAEALQRARPATPVLYMSGYAAAIMTAQGVLDPGVTVVSKPFTKAGLLSALNAALTKEPPPGGSHPNAYGAACRPSSSR
jgi:two-component system, cell cycle sensor histidine kinase and response regulator CckA